MYRRVDPAVEPDRVHGTHHRIDAVGDRSWSVDKTAARSECKGIDPSHKVSPKGAKT